MKDTKMNGKMPCDEKAKGKLSLKPKGFKAFAGSAKSKPKSKGK